MYIANLILAIRLYTSRTDQLMHETLCNATQCWTQHKNEDISASAALILALLVSCKTDKFIEDQH